MINRAFVLTLILIAVNQSDCDAQDSQPGARFQTLVAELEKEWPKNRTIRFVFHGHSVPAGYFKTPVIRRFDSYPLLFQQQMGDRFPTAAVDTVVTAIGGENSKSGALRFSEDVLSLKPDVVFIDYSLNDRRLSVEEAKQYWELMIVEARQSKVEVVLLTVTPDSREDLTRDDSPLNAHAKQVRNLAKQYDVPVVDSYAAFRERVEAGENVKDYLSQTNHPNRKGHEVVTELIMNLFPKPR